MLTDRADRADGADAAALNERLRRRYADVVDLAMLRDLAVRRPLSGRSGLSGLFVPAVGDSYLRSRVRVMIVGRETAGWGKLHTDLATPERTGSVADYLAHQMEKHRRMVAQVGAGSKFFQFYRDTARKVAAPEDRAAQDAPVWANLFCFDDGKTRPDRASDPATADIVRLSGALLRIQVEVLRPALIVFTTGSSCDRYVRQHFADRFDSTVHLPKRLWEFKLPVVAAAAAAGKPGHALAFRTPHPRHAASAALRRAIVADALAPGALAACLASLNH
jgi:hypothetical protein